MQIIKLTNILQDICHNGHSLNEVVFRVGKVEFDTVKVTVEDNKVVVKLQDEEA